MPLGPSRKLWKRLSVRLSVWHSALLLAMVSAVISVSYFALELRMREQDNDVVVSRLYQYTAEYSRGGLSGVVSLAAMRKGRAQKALFVRLADTENRTLFVRDSDDWVEFNTASLESATAPEAGEGIEWQKLPSPMGYEMLVAGTRLADGFILQIGKATDNTEETLSELRLIGWAILGLSIPLSLLGGSFVVSRGLRPLRSLTRTVKEIEETAQFSKRTPVSGSGDELDELARIFNATMARIEGLLKTMGDSLDNVAHDLRTPMTRMRHRAQNCLENCSQEEEYREALIDCMEESDRVLQMLDTLMDIAEAESGLTRLSAGQVCVARLLVDTIDLYQEVAEDKGITVELSAEDHLTVEGDALLLRRVVANLLDNAIKYTGRGGNVKLSATLVEPDAIGIRIADSGAGIPAEELEKVWERLYRGDKSRSERGLGLGLSFVKAIVEAHGGQVRVESTPSHGAVFTVTLPVKLPVGVAATRPVGA